MWDVMINVLLLKMNKKLLSVSLTSVLGCSLSIDSALI